MKRSIVKILLQIGALGVAVMLVFLVLPGVQLKVPSLLAFFILGLLLGLLYTFVRPVLVAITGRLLIATMGLFLIILNFIIFVLLIWLFPGEVIVSEPRWLWVLLASVLIGLLGTLFESLLGLNRPELDEVGRGQMLWRVLDTLPTPRRSALIENLRIQQVYETVMSYGLDIAISRTPLKSIREWVAKNILRQGEPGEELSTPAKVRMMLQELGPTYVKFGQIVSSQAGTLPKDWEQELAKLQSTVPPFPSDEARAIIQQELKHPVSELYATFEDKPLAAASTAQVHRATLADGTKVVVKVQRPRILAQTKADLGVLQQFGGVLAKRFRFARALDLGGILNEFAAGVLKELDYNNEAYQAQRLNDNLQSLPDVRVPTIFRPLSTSRVMTMDYVEGVKVTNVAAIKAAGLDCAELSDRLTRAFVKQVLFDGFFHGDPHPGNVVVNLDTGVITLIDCGLVGELNVTQRLDLLDLIWSLSRKDVRGLSDAIFRLCKPTRQVDKLSYQVSMERLIYQYVIYGSNTSFGAFMNTVLGSLYEFGLRMDSNLTLAIKAIIQMEEAASALNPEHDLTRIANEFASSYALNQITSEKVSGVLQEQAIRLGREVARRLPDLETAAFRWLDQFNKGGLEVKLDTSDLTQQMDRLEVILRRLVIGLILAGLIVGTAIVASSQYLASQATLPAIATGVFVLVVIASLIVIWRMSRPDKPK